MNTNNDKEMLAARGSGLGHSTVVSKLYRFSSHKASSIALISVGRNMSSVEGRTSTAVNPKRTHAEQRASSGTGTTQSSLFFFWFSSILKNMEGELLPIIHQTRGTPRSRHAACISPSASNPQIALRRAPTSGPSILRSGVRASP